MFLIALIVGIAILTGSGVIGSKNFYIGLGIGCILIFSGFIKVILTECTKEKEDEYIRRSFDKEIEEWRKWNPNSHDFDDK